MVATGCILSALGPDAGPSSRSQAAAAKALADCGPEHLSSLSPAQQERARGVWLQDLQDMYLPHLAHALQQLATRDTDEPMSGADCGLVAEAIRLYSAAAAILSAQQPLLLRLGQIMLPLFIYVAAPPARPYSREVLEGTVKLLTRLAKESQGAFKQVVEACSPEAKGRLQVVLQAAAGGPAPTYRGKSPAQGKVLPALKGSGGSFRSVVHQALASARTHTQRS